MLRRILLPAVALLVIGSGSPQASAGNPASFGGFPFGMGFYQPYGIRYSTSVRTPPYFAVNPPVYYGQRHYRPYGASPFASLPLVEAGRGYQTRPGAEFVRPPQRPPMMNPHCELAADVPADTIADVAPVRSVKLAPIQTNPYAVEQLAQAAEKASR